MARRHRSRRALGQRAGAVVVDVVEPALAAGTPMRSFMTRTRAAVPADAPLYFFGGHPDYEVAFYADRRLPTLRRRDLDRIASIDAGGTRVLIFERRWQTLDRATRARFVVEDRSAAVRDADRGRLLLARLRPPDAAAASTLSPASSGRSSS